MLAATAPASAEVHVASPAHDPTGEHCPGEPRPLKVAVLNRTFAKRAGGAERYSVEVAEVLSQQPGGAFEIHVFAQEFEASHPDLHLHRVFRPFTRPRWLNQLWFSLATWWMTRSGFDVVHSHEHVWHGQVQTLSVQLLKHNLVTRRSGWSRFKSWLRLLTSPRLLAYWFLESARLRAQARRVVVAVSASVREELAQSYPHCLPMVRVIPPGVAPPFATLEEARQARSTTRAQMRHRWGVPHEASVVLFVANDFHRKGLDALLPAIRELDGDVHLVVAGASQHQARYEAQVHELGLASRVHFIGSQDSMWPVYLSADVLAHPTLGDTWAMVVVEAMCCALPVVVSNARYCGVSAELSAGRDAVLLDDPRDTASVAASLRALLHDPVLSGRLQEHGFDFAQSVTWAQVAAEYARIYTQVAAA